MEIASEWWIGLLIGILGMLSTLEYLASPLRRWIRYLRSRLELGSWESRLRELEASLRAKESELAQLIQLRDRNRSNLEQLIEIDARAIHYLKTANPYIHLEFQILNRSIFELELERIHFDLELTAPFGARLAQNEVLIPHPPGKIAAQSRSGFSKGLPVPHKLTEGILGHDYHRTHPPWIGDQISGIAALSSPAGALRKTFTIHITIPYYNVL